jgi:catechol 2,3-dioxygenase-like lactoylglutathione lyase family enzyme
MPLKAFDHVNVRTANLEAMVQWYDTILDMKAGARPDFPFGGAWLYLGDLALVAQEEQPKSVDPQIEHLAISATGFEGFMAHLEKQGVEARVSKIESFGITQVNIFDPDGNHIHIDFMDD